MVPSKEPPGDFCDFGCCFIFTGGFSVIAFQCHSSPFHVLSPGLSLQEFTHFILSAQLISDLDTFVLTFLDFSFYHKHYGLCRHFLPTSVFYLALFPHILTHFVTQMLVEAPHPGSQSCHIQLVHGLKLLIFDLQDHWFADHASEPQSME